MPICWHYFNVIQWSICLHVNSHDSWPCPGNIVPFKTGTHKNQTCQICCWLWLGVMFFPKCSASYINIIFWRYILWQYRYGLLHQLIILSKIHVIYSHYKCTADTWLLVHVHMYSMIWSTCQVINYFVQFLDVNTFLLYNHKLTNIRCQILKSKQHQNDNLCQLQSRNVVYN